MLDALLAAMVCNRLGLLAPANPMHAERVAIPIALEPDGRFHLCSEAQFREDEHELRYKQRRAPVMQYARLGANKIKRVDIAAGPNKGHRVPYVVRHVDRDTLRWWCIGEADAIADLLADVRYIGRFRGSGKGKLAAPWVVDRCEGWPGFPVLRDGKPLRPLPLDYPGLVQPRQGFRCLTMPYWNHSNENLCAIPS
jgi:hypothetical protein